MIKDQEFVNTNLTDQNKCFVVKLNRDKEHLSFEELKFELEIKVLPKSYLIATKFLRVHKNCFHKKYLITNIEECLRAKLAISTTEGVKVALSGSVNWIVKITRNK
uniref:Uncharacterized protein n=1 Tax=Macaca fascicularis TaxID=9541 RepID=A0A7N9CJ71_MACFA